MCGTIAEGNATTIIAEGNTTTFQLMRVMDVARTKENASQYTNLAVAFKNSDCVNPVVVIYMISIVGRAISWVFYFFEKNIIDTVKPCENLSFPTVHAGLLTASANH